MPLKIETLFCDAALERDLLSEEELNECLERAGENGCVHHEALDAGYVTEAQVRRVYRRIYKELNHRYRKLRQARGTCGACEEPLAARYGLAYRVVYCPSCLEPVELGREMSRVSYAPADELMGVETGELTEYARQAGLVDASPESEPPPDTVAGLEVVERLAEHGMGAIYRVRGESGDLVVRVLGRQGTPVDLVHLLDQWKALTRLDHPNIRPLKKVKRDEEAYYLFSEYFEGQNLEQLRARSGRLRPRLVLKVAHQIAMGLEAAHDAGILHLGLTPVRVLVCADKRVMVIDFGLGYTADAIADYMVTGEMEGHPGFISPEQCLGHEVDGRSDLYSLGMLMTYCLTGFLPFGDDPPSAVYRQAHGQFPGLAELIPDLDPSIVQLVNRLVARDPDQRYPDAKAVLADLGYIISGRAPTFVADHVSLARINRVREIQGEHADSTGRRVPFVELLEAQGYVDRAEGTVEEIFAAESYTCDGAGHEYDADEAAEQRYTCPRCGGGLAFDERVAMHFVDGRLLVVPSQHYLADPDHVEVLDRHLRVALGGGVRKLVIDLADSPEARGAELVWTVSLAEVADKMGGRLVLLFADDRERSQFAALGFDQFVEVHPSRRVFYQREMGVEAPEPAEPPESEARRASSRMSGRVSGRRGTARVSGRRSARRSARIEAQMASAAPPAFDPRGKVAFEGMFFEAYESKDYEAALHVLYTHYDEDAAFSARWSYYQAVCLWRTGRYSEALTDLELVLDAVPDDAEAIYLRAMVHQATGDVEAAIDDLSRTIELEPDHVKALCNRGAQLYALGEHDDALDDFEAALEINPRHVRSLFGMGTICVERGQLKLAEDLLQRGVRTDPEFPWTYYSLARLAMRQKRRAEALTHLRQAVARAPKIFKMAQGEADFDALRADAKLGPHYELLGR